MTGPGSGAGAKATSAAAGARSGAGWRVVAGQETRDLWTAGRGPELLFGFSVLMSLLTYLAATSSELNFLEQREAVNLAVQITVGVGVLVTLVVSADGISGERERGTLETLLLTPVSRRAIVAGKLAGALSLWFGAFAVAVPYVWVLGRGVSLVAEAVLLGLAVGTLLAVALAALGLLVSSLSPSTRASIPVSLFLLLALFAPTQLPALPQGGFGDVLDRVDPVGAALRYLGTVLVDGQSWTTEVSYLVSPALLAVAAGSALMAGSSWLLRLRPGVGPG